MSEQVDPASPPPAARRSKMLTVGVVTLLILPLVLPFPFNGLADLLFDPAGAAAWQACQSFDCPAALNLSRLAVCFALGPSILVAVASILLGTIGLVRTRRHPTSPKNVSLFRTSILGGAIWVVLLGLILWLFVGFLIYL